LQQTLYVETAVLIGDGFFTQARSGDGDRDSGITLPSVSVTRPVMCPVPTVCASLEAHTLSTHPISRNVRTAIVTPKSVLLQPDFGNLHGLMLVV